MDDKQLINESIKVADVLAKELSFWKRLFIYTCIVLLAILIIKPKIKPLPSYL